MKPNPYELKQIDFQELTKRVLFPELMKTEGRYAPINNHSFAYKDMIIDVENEIKGQFDSLENVRISESYNGQPVRLELTDLSSVIPIVDFFLKETGAELSEVSVTRNCVIDVPRAEGVKNFEKEKHWYSEFWHVDPFKDGHFKVGIFLTDVVDEGCAPFEYLEKPEQHFYEYRKFPKGFESNSRFPEMEGEPSTKLFVPKYTTIVFSPAFIHKGNYARTQHRDWIMIGFNQGRITDAAKRVLEELK